MTHRIEVDLITGESKIIEQIECSNGEQTIAIDIGSEIPQGFGQVEAEAEDE